MSTGEQSNNHHFEKEPSFIEPNELSNVFVTHAKSNTMPALWQSHDPGTSWALGDYIFVLQFRPCMQTQLMFHIANGGNLFDPLQDSNDKIRYLWSFSIFYKHKKGPQQQNDSTHWPVAILTLEQVNHLLFSKLLGMKPSPSTCDDKGWDSPALCAFLPGGVHRNMGNIKDRWNINTCSFDSLSPESKEQLEKKLVAFFFKISCLSLGLSGEPVRIGNMYDGFCAVCGEQGKNHDIPKEKTITSDNSRQSSAENFCEEEKKTEEPRLPTDVNNQPAGMPKTQKNVQEMSPAIRRIKHWLENNFRILALTLLFIITICVICTTLHSCGVVKAKKSYRHYW